ncbi:MAG: MFS transporter, partial [Actinobacteria bacterium]|nr:MFS transporter [Actinomycetota bacterium]
GGALYSASRRGNRLRTLVAQAGLLVIGYLALAAMTTPLGLAVALLPVGVVTMLVVTGANATVQLSAPRSSLGRIMGIYILVSLGTAALGGPLVGYVDHAAGPRVGYLLAAAVPAVVLMVIWLTTLRRPGSDARNASAPSSDRDRRVTRPGRNGSHPTRHRGREDDDEPGLRAGRVHDPRRQ